MGLALGEAVGDADGDAVDDAEGEAVGLFVGFAPVGDSEAGASTGKGRPLKGGNAPLILK